jgi:hypothetical protein
MSFLIYRRPSKAHVFATKQVTIHREIVVGRFGLEIGGAERTQREIAKELGNLAIIRFKDREESFNDVVP